MHPVEWLEEEAYREFSKEQAWEKAESGDWFRQFEFGNVTLELRQEVYWQIRLCMTGYEHTGVAVATREEAMRGAYEWVRAVLMHLAVFKQPPPVIINFR